MLAYDYPLISLFFLVCWWFFIFAVFFGVIWAFVDNFRRKDHSGWAKAGWGVPHPDLSVVRHADLSRRSSRGTRHPGGHLSHGFCPIGIAPTSENHHRTPRQQETTTMKKDTPITLAVATYSDPRRCRR